MRAGPGRRHWRIPASWKIAVVAIAGLSAWLAASSEGTPRPVSLRTPSPTANEVHLLALGDTGANTPEQHRVARAMNVACRARPCNAVLLLGDNFYPHGVASTADPGWIDKFEHVYDQPALNGVPFYPVLGNHDYGVGSFGSKQAQLDYSRLPVARCGKRACDGSRLTGKWVLPSPYYDVDLGLVHVFALDTQLFVGTQQAKHMKHAIGRSTARWKIAIGHHPLVTSGYHDDSGGLLGDLGMRELLESVLCSGIDLYLAGHDHDLEYVAPGAVAACPELALAVSGAGSSTRPAGDAATSRVEQSAFFDDRHVGFVSVLATTSTLNLRFVSGDDETLFDTALPRNTALHRDTRAQEKARQSSPKSSAPSER